MLASFHRAVREIELIMSESGESSSLSTVRPRLDLTDDAVQMTVN
jgi:hypothetical protein